MCPADLPSVSTPVLDLSHPCLFLLSVSAAQDPAGADRGAEPACGDQREQRVWGAHMPAIDRQHGHPVLPQWHRRPLRLRTVGLDRRRGREGDRGGGNECMAERMYG